MLEDPKEVQRRVSQGLEVREDHHVLPVLMTHRNPCLDGLFDEAEDRRYRVATSQNYVGCLRLVRLQQGVGGVVADYGSV